MTLSFPVVALHRTTEDSEEVYQNAEPLSCWFAKTPLSLWKAQRFWSDSCISHENQTDFFSNVCQFYKLCNRRSGKRANSPNRSYTPKVITQGNPSSVMFRHGTQFFRGCNLHNHSLYVFEADLIMFRFVSFQNKGKLPTLTITIVILISNADYKYHWQAVRLMWT